MTPVEWLLSGDTGISSQTILAVMTGADIGGIFHDDVPYDKGDFGRCYRLLLRFPEWRARLSEVSDKYPEWGPFVREWDALSALYEEQPSERWSKELAHRLRELRNEPPISTTPQQEGG